MWILWVVTALWAASFSLIGEFLSGYVDGYIAVFIRMVLAMLLFLPCWRPARLSIRQHGLLGAIGALQIGVMYLFLYHAFLYLTVPEVLLFTIFTPFYITLLDDWLFQRRRLPWQWWLATIIAIFGAAVIRYDALSDSFLTGFFLIQAANLCFAAGQVFYKHMELGSQRNQLHLFASFFIGATFITGIATLCFADFQQLPTNSLQWGILLWLGLGASGLGYLAWNLGAKQVNVAQLATMNNMLIPAGLIINYVFWGQAVAWDRLALGGSILLFSVWLASRRVC